MQQYRLIHRQKLAGRHRRNMDYARARSFNIVERLIYAAAAQDTSLEPYTGPCSTRLRDLRHLPPVRAMGRAVLALLKRRLQEVRHGVGAYYQRRFQVLSARSAATQPGGSSHAG